MLLMAQRTGAILYELSVADIRYERTATSEGPRVFHKGVDMSTQKGKSEGINLPCIYHRRVYVSKAVQSKIKKGKNKSEKKQRSSTLGIVHSP
jgi:hypothetical protein